MSTAERVEVEVGLGLRLRLRSFKRHAAYQSRRSLEPLAASRSARNPSSKIPQFETLKANANRRVTGGGVYSLYEVGAVGTTRSQHHSNAIEL